MKRRSFFKTGAMGGSVLAISGVAACTTNTDLKETEVDLSDFELSETTVAELQKKMESGELTSRNNFV